MSIRTFILGFSVILITTGCTSIRTSTSHDSSFDFSQLKTYSWGNNSVSAGRLGHGADELLEGVEQMARRDIQPLVDTMLAEKGFTKDSSGNPDFLVRYMATGTATHDIPQTYYPGTPPSIAYSTQVGTFMMGAIQIEISDPNTNNVIWRSYGETPITGDGSSNAKLTRALKKILRDFPPR
ncbi:DUF4136 domain-containing protein [Kaarinaea lacus]